jgi:hypothetical protein
MARLSRTELKLLEKAVAIGILSPVKCDQIIEWDAKNRGLGLQEPAPQGYGPVLPRNVTLSETGDLGIEIARRELANYLEEFGEKADPKRVAVLTRVLALMRNGGPPPEKSIDVSPVDQQNEPPRQLDPVETSAIMAMTIVKRLMAAESDLRSCPVSPKQTSNATLGVADFSLCLRWSDVVIPMDGLNREIAWDGIERLERYRQSQLLSARAAEIVASTYYQRLGFEVVDVSVEQIENQTDNWMFFDLKVGERHIDVKNARESFNGSDNYVEHCVPRFKQMRGTGENVVIAGVLSEYHADPSEYKHHALSAVVLGEVHVEQVRQTYSWARARFGAKLDLKGIWDVGFLPGWLFEYPKEHYPRREGAIHDMEALAWELVEAGAMGNHLPGWLLVLCPDESLIRSLPLNERKRRIVVDLRSMASDIGISRRSLFVYAMGLTLDALAQDQSADDDLAMLLEMLHVPGGGEGPSSMLGLHDPMGYVSSMIDTLRAIAERLLAMKLRLVGFKLIHPAILKGVCNDGKHLTLLAYCGGWQTYPMKVKCGTTPLSIVAHVHCPTCGHLVCPNCGHCSNLCRQCEPRQHEVVQTAMAAETEPTDPVEEWRWQNDGYDLNEVHF